MTSSADLIAAAGDDDLRRRAVALLAATGHATPDAVIAQRMGQLVAVAVGEAGQTIADVYAYAVATYTPPEAPPRPGQNPAAVTDDQLRQALQAIGALQEDA